MSEAVEAPLLMTVAKAVKYSGRSRTKIYELLVAGILKVKKVGRSTLVVVASLVAVIDNLKDF